MANNLKALYDFVATLLRAAINRFRCGGLLDYNPLEL